MGHSFLNRLSNETSVQIVKKTDEHQKYFTDFEIWSLLTGVRFAISRIRETELSQLGVSIEQLTILRILQDRDVLRR